MNHIDEDQKSTAADRDLYVSGDASGGYLIAPHLAVVAISTTVDMVHCTRVLRAVVI